MISVAKVAAIGFEDKCPRAFRRHTRLATAIGIVLAIAVAHDVLVGNEKGRIGIK
jgi:hypothetical protein